MKCQIMFSGKNKKNNSIYHLLKSLLRVLNINANPTQNAHTSSNKVFFPIKSINVFVFLISACKHLLLVLISH